MNIQILFNNTPNSFQINDKKILVDENDWKGVIRAVEDLSNDIFKVTNKKSEIIKTNLLESKTIIIGTIGKSKLINSLIENKKIDITNIENKWESYIIQADENNLIICGSDKRGTIFGIYEISRQIGVSPWYWWADVPIKKHDYIFIKYGNYIQDSPKVKYRGIFINDEEPSFGGWAREKFGGCNSKMYAHIFELLLRLKSNYMWPAMWWKAFNEDDPENPRLADEYGIVIGTNHHEPMMRNMEEWHNYPNHENWNYKTNKDQIYQFWKEGINRNSKYENIVTIGMRGDNDDAMHSQSQNMNDNINLLTNIIEDQRKLISEAYNKPAQKVPQLWVVYKEVEDYYKHGMKVPDDVTIMWSDDNWGNICNLPNENEQKHPGGLGLYYHLDYVGGPHSYRWLNTNPIPKLWHNLNLAYRYNMNQIWMINVGDLKPMQLPIDFIMQFAYDPDNIPPQKIKDYIIKWVKEQFNDQYIEEIADMVSKYTKYNGWRKPQIIGFNTFNISHNYEADYVLNCWLQLVKEAEDIKNKISQKYQDAYFELVYFPLKASAQVAELQISVGKNYLYTRQGRASTIHYIERVKELFNKDKELTNEYHKIANNKWNHMMDQPHIGTSWNGWDTPDQNIMPRFNYIEIPNISEIGVAVENNDNTQILCSNLTLPTFDYWNPLSHSFEIFNRGTQNTEFKIETEQSWIITNIKEGIIINDIKVNVNLNWDKLNNGTHDGCIKIISPNKTIFVSVKAIKANLPLAFNIKTAWGSLSNIISIPANKPLKISLNKDLICKEIPDYGYFEGGMGICPTTNKNNIVCLQYFVYISKAGTHNVTLYTSPTQSDITIQFGNQQSVLIKGKKNRVKWDQIVTDNCCKMNVQIRDINPGGHILKIYLNDPTIIIEKILIFSNEILPPTYFGPKFNIPLNF